MRPKESGKVRYAYGVAMALLLGGTAFSLATGQAGAQIPQNAPGTAALAPRPGAPMSFADLVAKLQPAVVNISTKQRIPVRAQTDPFEESRAKAHAARQRHAAAAELALEGSDELELTNRMRASGWAGSLTFFLISPAASPIKRTSTSSPGLPPRGNTAVGRGNAPTCSR